LARRQAAFEHHFRGSPAVKDVIEALGVPHTEVDLILINGSEAGFGTQLSDGDRVSVYPVFESFDIAPATHLRRHPLRQPRFVLDVHLGRLATFLRLLGFDAEYSNSFDDDELSEIAVRDGRILLTRDRGLLKRAAITRGYCVRSTQAREQTFEILSRFDLLDLVRPFSRCMACNGALESAAKAEVADSLPPRVAEAHEDFTHCVSCGRVYWRGSHYDRLNQVVQAIVKEASQRIQGT
jgi:uncharacterized protein with PIN domain